MNIIEEINLIKEAIRFDRLAELLDVESSNRKEIAQIKALLDPDQTAKVMSEGAVIAQVNLMEELNHCQIHRDELMEYIMKELERMKLKINEMIHYVKNTNQ